MMMRRTTMSKVVRKPDGKMVIKVKKGALHEDLGVKQGEKIPASKLAIKPTDSKLEKKRKQFAINAKKFNHSK